MAQWADIAIFALPVIVAITLHEAAHGYAARHFGDDTAEKAGRVSLNPLRHIDLVGTILLPVILYFSKAGFLFGYAKPVPVNFAALHNPRRDMIWVAAAGPGMNILLGLISFMLLAGALLFRPPPWLAALLWDSIHINLVLAVFNLWPIPPLDGSKILIGWLPPALGLPLLRLSRYGMLFLLVIFLLAPMAGLDIFGMMVGRPVDVVERFLVELLRHV